MISVLLCAGFATRMYPLTKDFPKPLLPVADKPVIDYFMDQILQLPDINSVHIVTNSKFYKFFERWLQELSPSISVRNLDIYLHNDGSTAPENRRGVIADLQFVFQNISTPAKTLVSAGDNIYRFRIEPLWRQFLSYNRHYTLALPELDKLKLQRTGVPVLGKNNKVMRLHEKKRLPPFNWFCPPLYFFQASVWPRLNEFIKISADCDELGTFIDFLCQKENVMAFKLNKSRLDIGDMGTYLEADDILRKESVY